MGRNLSRCFVTGRASSLYVAECWYTGGDLSRALQVLRAVQTGQFVGQQKFCWPTWRADKSVLTVADFLVACSRRPMFFMSPTKKLMSGWFVGRQTAGQCEHRINSYVLQQQTPEWSDILEPAYLARTQDFSLRSSGVAGILCQGAQVWRREKTENNKCMSYHLRQHCILLSMRYCIRSVCHSHTIIKWRYTIV